MDKDDNEPPPGIERHMVDGKVQYLPKVPDDDAKFAVRHAIKILHEWNQVGTYPWMKRRTANLLAPRLAWWLSLVVLGLHGWWAISTSCGLHFARCGAAIVLISAIGFGWTTWHDGGGGWGGGPVNRWAFFHPLFMLPALAFIGTVIWGYGDLLPFGRNC